MIKFHVKERAAACGLMQKEILQATKIRPTTLSDMYNNKNTKHIPLDVLGKLCAVLECQPGDLLEYVPDDLEEQ